MKEYDFNKLLSPLDFELLSRDLMQRELGIIFESFKEGRDQGIDFKFSTFISTNSIVLQCKNYKNDYSYFFRELKKELEKVKKLNPHRYMITTSVNLSNANKEEIKEYFEPYILKTSDIYGGNDLNNLLSKPANNDIEKQHSKLWLASTNILERVLHSNIHCQSEMLLEEIEWKTSFFVYSQSYEEALNILRKERCCIISGNPGVGKTTLAYMLLLEFIKNEKNFEIIEIKSFDEANKVWNRDKKQVFYFDDFLGKNFRTIKLDKNEDSNIARLMKRISRYENKYIIFTTREYILNQAKHDYEALSGADFELTKMIIDINRYSNKIKAEILYNHLHFSSLPDAYVHELLVDYSFLKIINHKNYNPRIVEHLTDIKLLNKSDIEVEEYREYFLENLDNPIKIWSDIFENDKISFEAKILVYALFVENIQDTHLWGSSLYIVEDRFNDLYDFYINQGRIQKQESLFYKVLKELDNSFVHIKNDSSTTNLYFYDPSINDFLFQYLSKNIDILIELIKSFKLFSSEYELNYLLSNIVNLDNEVDSKKITFNNQLQNLFIQEVSIAMEEEIEYLKFIDIVITKNLIEDNTIVSNIKNSLQNFNLYENTSSDDEEYFIHDIEIVYEYYQLSLKYNINNYTNQELYTFVINQNPETFYSSELYAFTYMTQVSNIERDKKEERDFINFFMKEFINQVYDTSQIVDLCKWEEEYINEFKVQKINDKLQMKSKELYIKRVEHWRNKDSFMGNIDNQEIIDLFDSLRE